MTLLSARERVGTRASFTPESFVVYFFNTKIQRLKYTQIQIMPTVTSTTKCTYDIDGVNPVVLKQIGGNLYLLPKTAIYSSSSSSSCSGRIRFDSCSFYPQ
jgi:hypothetical protein